MNKSQARLPANSREQLWQQILDSSNALDSAAKSSDWEALAPLIDARFKLLKSFFAEPLATTHSKHLEQIQLELKAILRQTKSNQSLCEKNQERIAAEIQQLNKGKQALAGYQ